MVRRNESHAETAEKDCWLNRGPGGHPWWGMQGGNAPLPAGGLAVERCLKEHLSKRGQCAGCPLTNPR